MTTTITLEQIKSGAAKIAPDAKVRIYSREHHCWWRRDGCGYATDIAEAGAYTFEDAFARSRHCDPSKRIEYDVLPPESPPLPTIHPLLGDKAPRWTDEAETKCGCDQCQHWSPLIQHIGSELSAERHRLLNDLVEDWVNTREELSLANAKLDGSWPGWEAMKGFKPNQETA